VFNASYNPSGKTPAALYRFPYEDESFDFVILTSVFTHMLPDDLEQYVSEISRVLRSQGRCLMTFFLLNTESVRLLEAGQSLEQFDNVTGSYRTANARVPEQAVAYDESYVQAVLQRHSLRIQPPIHYGSWCCREKHLSYQDIVIAEKGQAAGQAIRPI
jgi:SAM-dependent methyltransferase